MRTTIKAIIFLLLALALYCTHTIAYRYGEVAGLDFGRQLVESLLHPEGKNNEQPHD